MKKKLLVCLIFGLVTNYSLAEMETFSFPDGEVTIDVGDAGWWQTDFIDAYEAIGLTVTADWFEAAVNAAIAKEGFPPDTNNDGVITCANSGDLSGGGGGGTVVSSGGVDTGGGGWDYGGWSGPTCGSCTKTNVCGQVFTGDDCSGTCNAGSGIADLNSSCISNFECGSGLVSPNGSIECKFNVSKNVKSVCGFVDFTSNIPRPIPGLQNLDSNLESVRISNIQTTTRFCLVCKFYSLISDDFLGEAVKHQWVRVIRLGEN